jgi:hypothetical protein
VNSGVDWVGGLYMEQMVLRLGGVALAIRWYRTMRCKQVSCLGSRGGVYGGHTP